MHAEAVLLVDDRQCEIAKRDPFLHQRVGTDHHLRLAGCDLGQHLPARAAGDLAGQPGHAHAQRLKPAAQVVEVLLGEQFGRRHQCGLLAGLDREHRGERGDHGLAAADIALHQPQHRRRPAEVGADLVEHALLGRCQHERQGLAQQLGQPCRLQHRRRMRLLNHALAPQAEVVGEQFLQRQPSLRRMHAGEQRGDIGVLRGPVHGQQRFAQRGQVQVFAKFPRQQFQ